MDNIDNINGIRFLQKKESVPYHNRLTYKATILLLILLKCCRGRGCSIEKFQILMNYLYSKESQDTLIDFVETKKTFVYLRFDSTIIKALEFMKSEGLIDIQQNVSFKMTDKGRAIAIAIWEDKEVFLFEKAFLSKMGSSLTENLVQEINNSIFGN